MCGDENTDYTLSCPVHLHAWNTSLSYFILIIQYNVSKNKWKIHQIKYLKISIKINMIYGFTFLHLYIYLYSFVRAVNIVRMFCRRLYEYNILLSFNRLAAKKHWHLITHVTYVMRYHHDYYDIMLYNKKSQLQLIIFS